MVSHDTLQFTSIGIGSVSHWAPTETSVRSPPSTLTRHPGDGAVVSSEFNHKISNQGNNERHLVEFLPDYSDSDNDGEEEPGIGMALFGGSKRR